MSASNGDTTAVVRGEEGHVARVPAHIAGAAAFAPGVGVTERFKQIVGEFSTPSGETPAGFRVEPLTERDGSVRFDLVRDIATRASSTTSSASTARRSTWPAPP